MPYKPVIDESQIKTWLQELYNYDDVDLTYLEDDGECSWGYIVKTNNKTFFLKMSTPHLCSDFIDETVINAWQILFYDFGISQICSPPLRAKTGKYINDKEHDDLAYRLMLMPAINGEKLADVEIDQRKQEQLGSLLLQLHRCRMSERERPPTTDFASDYASRLKKMLEEVDNPIGFYSPMQSQTLAHLRKYRPKIMAVLKAFELSRNEILSDGELSKRFVVCHGDPRLRNIIVNESGQLIFIDMDTLTYAPPERDLFAVQHLPHLMDLYQRRNEQFEINKHLMRYYQLEQDVKEILDYAGRVMSNKQIDQYNERDLKSLENHLKTITPSSLASNESLGIKSKTDEMPKVTLSSDTQSDISDNEEITQPMSTIPDATWKNPTIKPDDEAKTD